MTKFGRVRSALVGLGTVLLGLLVSIMPPKDAVMVAAFLMSVSLIILGIRMLIHYCTMGQYMVGGSYSLVGGVILVDFGVFILTMVDNPTVFIIIYMLVFHAFLGLVDILRGLEAWRFHAGAWKRSLANGLVNLGIAVVALLSAFVFHSYGLLVTFYAMGMIYRGFVQIGKSFRKTAIVYIQ